MSDRNYGALFSAEKFEAFVDRMLASDDPFGFDIESGHTGEARPGLSLLTEHPDWILVGFSFTNSLDWARYVPVAHDTGENVDDVVRTARALWRLLQSGQGVAHNLSFELKGLSRWFMDLLADDPEVGEAVREAHGLFPYRSDSLIEAFLTGLYNPLNPGQDLKSLVKHVFDHQMIEFKELFPELRTVNKARFNTLAVSAKVVTYACEDSLWCLAMHKKHRPLMEGKRNLIYRTEIALIEVLVRMEKEGVAIDWDLLNKKAEEVKILGEKYNEEIQAELSKRLGEVVNINLGSVKQLSEILFDRLGLPVKVRSEKTNAPSTSEKALGLIAKADPVVGKILDYRSVVKLYGSYLDKYRRELTYAPSGRAHPNHKQTGAATGRMSVSDLPYQQWPKPYHYALEDGTTFDLNFRDLAVAPAGYRIIGFDYSQVELRVLAGQAEETALLQAFADGTDIHVATASNMMGIPVDQVTKKIRARGKTLNFAVVYGSGAENIANMLTSPDDPVTTEDAEILLSKYFAAFSKLKWWMDSKVAEGREQGYVETLFGRRFTVWEYTDSRPFIRSKGDRMCVNAPIQGGAADYMKIAMVRTAQAIKDAGMQDKIRLVMTIHDALEFYVHESVPTQTVLDLVGPCVSYPVKGLPEIRADWHEGRTWGSVVEIKRDEAGKISHYAIEDVDGTFETLEEAYAYQDREQDEEAAEPQAEEVPEPEPMQHAYLTLSAMPDENLWFLFVDYVRKKKIPDAPGLTLITPEGSKEIPGVLLTKEDQPKISALLGGATLTFGSESEDLDDLLEGIE